ncbi:gliding motility lipoprotein GldH [Salegentibacter salinarum]|uniref:Gliding motility lipoprotein GldH n=1 Tax=Salegentibacter salinarum TaxID=447422 RepID=A0A2N0U3Z7_9FLAO|nr:gliding motility lipoprotein GldH [Salegentibacter salinarum]PKD21732.1 gliding motility lipoprotein GldH [Salegentibacter salinarum]SKB34410.1 gliding motility-associated lipoprotein GldH [Salegentibacter salinarum]
MRKAAVFLTFIGVFALLASCDKKRVYDEYKPIHGGWEKDSTLVFNLGELDSLQNYNLFINVRNNKDYNYRNLFLITEMRFPQGKVVTDTLEYEMAAPDGSWLGTGFGDVKESKLWYKENVSFTEPGEYKIAIIQAMRKNDEVEGIENLEGITHIGFRIEENLQ